MLVVVKVESVLPVIVEAYIRQKTANSRERLLRRNIREDYDTEVLRLRRVGNLHHTSHNLRRHGTRDGVTRDDAIVRRAAGNLA